MIFFPNIDNVFGDMGDNVNMNAHAPYVIMYDVFKIYLQFHVLAIGLYVICLTRFHVIWWFTLGVCMTSLFSVFVIMRIL
jgi:hypothetical protein